MVSPAVDIPACILSGTPPKARDSTIWQSFITLYQMPKYQAFCPQHIIARHACAVCTIDMRLLTASFNGGYRQTADTGTPSDESSLQTCLAGRVVRGFRSVLAAGGQTTDALRRALLIGFANRLARRMSQHNGYKTLNEHSTLAQLHPSTAPLTADEYGLTPDYLIYTSLVATARVFLSKVGACCLSTS